MQNIVKKLHIMNEFIRTRRKSSGTMDRIWLSLTFCAIALGHAAKQDKGNVVPRLAINAQPVSPGEFPHQVSLQLDGSHTCGGALISSIHVLTASHCVDDYIKKPHILLTQKLVVEVGSVIMGSGTTHQVRRVSHKADFDRNQDSPYFMSNDIAVITLRNPVTISKHVRPVSLPDPSMEVPEGSRVWVSGFGSYEAETPSSKILRKAELFILPQQRCDEFYAKNFKKNLLSSHICTQRGPGHGTCQGDSGGPLIWNSQVVGVVSGGTGRCNEGHPDVYTRVSSHLNYIRYEMNYDFNRKNQANDPAKAIDIDQLSASFLQPSAENTISRRLTLPSEQQLNVQQLPPIFYPPGGQFYPQQGIYFPASQFGSNMYPLDFYKSKDKLTSWSTMVTTKRSRVPISF